MNDLVALPLQHTTRPCFATICATRLLHWQACPLDAGARWKRVRLRGEEWSSSQTQRVLILGLLEKSRKSVILCYTLFILFAHHISKPKLLLWILKRRLMRSTLMLNSGRWVWEDRLCRLSFHVNIEQIRTGLAPNPIQQVDPLQMIQLPTLLPITPLITIGASICAATWCHSPN